MIDLSNKKEVSIILDMITYQEVSKYITEMFAGSAWVKY